MANSDRKIIRGVRLGTTTYVPGQEDELDKLLSADEVKRLSDKGYIQGKWSGTAAPAAPATTEAKPAAEPVKSEPAAAPAAKKEK